MKDVHTEHCCEKHGCCYSDPDCTVITGRAPQSYRCESCEYEGRDVRPWGSYIVLVDEPTHKVKTITIKAGQRISLQRHQKRKENWICVSGSLRVGLGLTLDTVNYFTIYPGQSVIIDIGEVHRAEAVGSGDVTFIEVQTGTYFGEDDIERFEDDYGRS